MNPKPLVKSTPKRLPERKRMTLIAAFRHRDGVVIAADEEEVSGISKRKVEKLAFIDFWNEWQCVIGGAGDSAIIENATKRLQQKFSCIKPYDTDKVQEAIESVLVACHEKYIWPNPRSEGMRLIIGIKHPDIAEVFSTSEITPCPHESNQHVCIGIGADLANFFADSLANFWLGEGYAVMLAAFIFKQVRDNVLHVGGDTNMYLLRHDGIEQRLGASRMKEIEVGLPRFEDLQANYMTQLKGYAETFIPQKTGSRLFVESNSKKPEEQQ